MGEIEIAVEGPAVGGIVHLIANGGICYAAIMVRVDENGVMLHPFLPSDLASATPRQDSVEPYVSLRSARPTSGWHWPREH